MGKKHVRESNVMHRMVALYTGGQRDCAHEGSVIMHMRATGCAQEGSVAMAGCHSLLN